MTKSLIDTLNATPFVGLAVTFVHTGYTASIEFENGQWSPNEFGTCASDAILKAIRLHAPAPSVKAAAPPLAPLPPLPDLTPPAIVLPPPPPY
jgi:hypothetical protein